jgi:hypothetical protein
MVWYLLVVYLLVVYLLVVFQQLFLVVGLSVAEPLRANKT